MEVNILESIKQAQLLWDFKEVIRLKKEVARINLDYFDNYIKYLADCGKLNVIYEELKELEPSLLHKIMNSPNFSVCKYLYNLIQNRLLMDCIKEENNDISPLIIELAQLTFNKKHVSVLNLLSVKFESYFNKDSSAQDNMILNFALNMLMDSKVVTPNVLIKASKYIVLSKKINDQRKKFLLTGIINYCLCDQSSAISFFKLREQFYNHIQTILSFITQFNHAEYGATQLVDKVYYAIRKYNSINLVLKKAPKIAICISGICKGQDGVALKN